MTSENFEAFWESYPKKQTKKKAKTLFMKINKELFPKIMSAVDSQKAHRNWSDPQFIPMPTTWLHNERWEDSLDVKTGGNIRTVEEWREHWKTNDYLEKDWTECILDHFKTVPDSNACSLHTLFVRKYGLTDKEASLVLQKNASLAFRIG